MNNTEKDSNRRQEIQSSLNSIVESSDKWVERLRRREFRVRLAGSFLAGSLVLVAVGAAILGFFLSQGEEIDAFFEQQSLAFQFSLASSAAIAGLISGIATYFLLKRKHNARMKDLSSLMAEMKKKTNEQQKNANGAGGEGITKEALSLAEKIVTLLPELVRKRKHDSLLFGAVAFIVTNVVVSNFVVAIIVGVLVWLYVRHRTKKTYEHEMSKYEEQKRVFEQRKKDFIDTL
jgi:uncharacterized membrane protein (DUF106 family)